jgi:hypothetical protein
MKSVYGKTCLQASLAVVALLAALPVFAQISIGIRIGPPPAPRVVAVRPASPGPDFMWVEGYWYPINGHYRWHEGYWAQPPYGGAHWVAAHHDGERFFAGYWDGDHGRVDHDHPWTAERERDFRAREHDRDIRERDVRERDVREREHDREHDRDHERDHDRR